MNLCEVACANGSVPFAGERVSVASGRTSVVLGFRPESLELATEGLPARVEVVEEFGADAYVFCTAEIAGKDTRLVARVEARRRPERGERVQLRARAEDAHVFDPETGERI